MTKSFGWQALEKVAGEDDLASGKGSEYILDE